MKRNVDLTTGRLFDGYKFKNRAYSNGKIWKRNNNIFTTEDSGVLTGQLAVSTGTGDSINGTWSGASLTFQTQMTSTTTSIGNRIVTKIKKSFPWEKDEEEHFLIDGNSFISTQISWDNDSEMKQLVIMGDAAERARIKGRIEYNSEKYCEGCRTKIDKLKYAMGYFMCNNCEESYEDEFGYKEQSWYGGWSGFFKHMAKAAMETARELDDIFVGDNRVSMIGGW